TRSYFHPRLISNKGRFRFWLPWALPCLDMASVTRCNGACLAATGSSGSKRFCINLRRQDTNTCSWGIKVVRMPDGTRRGEENRRMNEGFVFPERSERGCAAINAEEATSRRLRSMWRWTRELGLSACLVIGLMNQT